MEGLRCPTCVGPSGSREFTNFGSYALHMEWHGRNLMSNRSNGDRIDWLNDDIADNVENSNDLEQSQFAEAVSAFMHDDAVMMPRNSRERAIENTDVNAIPIGADFGLLYAGNMLQLDFFYVPSL